jgi:hypothetical protein
MKTIIDYSYKLAVVALLAFIASKEHTQTNKSSYTQSVWIEGGEIKAFVTNDEKSKIPTSTALEHISLTNQEALPVTLTSPAAAVSAPPTN